MIRLVFFLTFLALSIGSYVYCAIAMVAAARYRRVPAPGAVELQPVSVLRPLAGAHDNTESNLRSLFTQIYPAFEVLLSVHEATDPAAGVAERIMAEFPAVPARLIVAGVSPLPNAKVWSLRALMPAARSEAVVMTDSDIRLPPDCLRTLMTELGQPGTGLVTCPYRAVPGAAFWSRLEAVGLNTDFLSGLLTQRFLNGMDFAIGCTIATRRGELDAIGGLEELQRYLAEDFVMGNQIYRAGRGVVLSRSVIEHHIGDDPFLKNWKHRLRWARSTRRSRPAGYIGEIFTKPFALSLIAWFIQPKAWELPVLALALRAAVAYGTAGLILRDPLIRKFWWALPLEDLASFATWLLGFFGRTIVWRGRRLELRRDGSLAE